MRHASVVFETPLLLLLLLLPNPFRGMGAWWKALEPQKSGNSPRPGPEVVERQSRQRASGAKSPWLDSAGRILDSANPKRDKSLTEGCVRRSVDEREHSERDEGCTSSSVEIEGACVSKNIKETVRLQSEKKEEWIREIRGERLHGIAEGTKSAPRLASSSAA